MCLLIFVIIIIRFPLVATSVNTIANKSDNGLHGEFRNVFIIHEFIMVIAIPFIKCIPKLLSHKALLV